MLLGERIRNALLVGARTKREISQVTGLEYQVVRYWTNKLDIPTKGSKEIKLEELEDLLINGRVSDKRECTRILKIT